MTNSKYPALMRVLHWVLALLIIGLIIVGLLLDSIPDTLRGQAIQLHKAFGVTVLGLLALRSLTRLAYWRAIPPMPGFVSAWQKWAAYSVHGGFYVLMLVIPLSGYIMSNAAGYPVAWFGVPLPTLVEKDLALRALAYEIHETAAFVMIGLIVLHVGAVVGHIVKDRWNPLGRIV